MGKKKNKVPKTIFGFKLSKGTRKDLKKLMKLFGNPDTRALAMTAASGIAAFLAERFGEHRKEQEAPPTPPPRSERPDPSPGISGAH